MNKRESMKRVLGFILALFVFVGCMPFMSQNVAAVSKSGVASDYDAEETITWEISGTDTVTLTFKGSGELPAKRAISYSYLTGKAYEDEKDGWRYYKTKIEKVVIGEGITSLGDEIFEGCEALKSVKLPTSLEKIGKEAFKGCTNLYSITLHEGLKKIDGEAFAGSGLKKVNIPSTVEFNAESASIWYGTGPGRQFAGCENLTEVTITNGVNAITQEMFSGCPITSIDIPNSVVVIGDDAFENCGSLKSIVIPASVMEYWDVSYYGSPGGLFCKCENLNDVIILSDAELPEGIFQVCTSLKRIVIPDGIKAIPYAAFYNCTSLEEIVMPEGLEEIAGQAFYNTAIKKITIPGSVTSIGGSAFCETELTDVFYTGSKMEWELLIENNTGGNNDPLINAKVHFIGWSKDTKGWRYYTSETAYHKNTWKKIDGKWYHFDASGYIQTGWQKLGGSWYYFNPSGHMVHGWYKADGKWYYFGWENDADSGAMRTGWVKADGTWYYMNSSGTMLTGWQTLGGKTYYLKPSGAMAANEYIGGYWLNGNGSWTYPYKATWRKSGNRWWYGDPTGWYAKNATYVIDGVKYSFDAAGWMK